MHTVIETGSYLSQAAKLGLSPEERDEIVDWFAGVPDVGDVMKGTGGARKARIAGRSKGKRGGYRVITFYAAEDVPVFLLDIYSKGDKDNLSDAECKAIKQHLDGLVEDYRASVHQRAKLLKRIKEK
jgi:hypothetical protein